MKKQLRKAMICTVAMMLVAIVSLTGVTYAWFSQSTSASVTGMQVEVEAKEGGVLMASDPEPGASGWRYKVNLHWSGSQFKPASTTPDNLDDAGNLTFYNGVIDEEKTYMIKTSEIAKKEVEGVISDEIEMYKTAPDAGYYIKKNLYFKNIEESDIIVTLGATIDGIEGKDGKKGADTAMRIAIVDHGEYDGTKSGTNGADKVFTKASTDVLIYEPNAREHVLGTSGVLDTYGVIAATGKDDNGKDKYINVNEDTTAGEEWENSEIYKIKNVTDYESAYVKLVDTYHADNAGKVAPKIEIPKKAENKSATYYKITVYIWLEGQDVDCINTIGNADLDISLSFSKTYKK